MTNDERRAYLRTLDEDTLWNTLCVNTPGGVDASIMSTAEMIEYGVANWGEDDELRPATRKERLAASAIHGSADINVDDDAKCAECSEGVWVAAWVWVSNDDIEACPHD